MSDYSTLREQFINARARRSVFTEQRNGLVNSTITLNQKLMAARRAQTVIQTVAERIQHQLEYGISKIVSDALSAVFDDPEEFRVRFIQRRGRTECDMFFVKNGQEMDVLGSVGGGVLDIVCFALRIAFLFLRHDIRRVLVLDEPFRNLHGQSEQERCSAMVKMMSTRLGIQIIMVSDIELINSAADRVFTCRLVDNVTQIETS